MNFSDLQIASLKNLREMVYANSLTEEKVKNLFIRVVEGLRLKAEITEESEFIGARLLKIKSTIGRTAEVNELTKTKLFRKLIKSAGISKTALDDNTYQFHVGSYNFDRFIAFIEKVEEENVEKGIEEGNVRTK